MEDKKTDKKRIIRALWFPLCFVSLLWIVKIIEVLLDTSFARFGVFPLEFSGLKGILFSPFIHGSWEHLINNSVPVLVLTWALFYFYREVSLKVFILIFLIHGFWLWFFGRGAYHIGASGIIYGLGSFLFISGIIRMNTNLIAVSLLVAFQYGYMIWGIFPMKENVSWEAHLTGLAAGLLLAFYYRKLGPEPNFGRWKYDPFEEEENEDDEESDEDPYWMADEEEKA